MNMWILLQRSVISLPLQRKSLQGFGPGWGGRFGARGVQRDFSPAPLQRTSLPRAFRGGMHICRSQKLKSLCGSLLAPHLSWKTATSSLQQGLVPQKDMASWLLGCGHQKYWGFRRELGTFERPGTSSLTNYGANSKSTAEGLP